jgi:hypothetical protein
MGFLKKLSEPRIMRRVFIERLTEPLHLNFLALWVAVCGSFRQRVNFDLILRQHNTFAILSAANRARTQELKKSPSSNLEWPRAPASSICAVSPTRLPKRQASRSK